MFFRKFLIASLLLALPLFARAELTVAIPQTEDSAGLRAIADSYASAPGGTPVTLIEAPYDELFDRAATEAEAGSGAFDVIMIDDPWITFFAENAYLEPLEPFYDAAGEDAPDSDFLAQSLALCRHPYGDGQFVCLPFVGNAQLFFYDWRQFERHGVFGTPASWDEVIEAARGITSAGRRDSFGYGTSGVRPGLSKYGYVYRGAEGNPIVADFLPILWSHGGAVLDASGNVVIDSEQSRQALDIFLQLANYAPPSAKNFGAEEVGESLAKGISASSINWPNWVAVFEDPERSSVVGRIAYGPIPSGTTVGRAEIGHWALGIAAASDDKAQAFDFIRWATSPAQQRIAAEHGNPPVRFSVFTDPELIAQERFRHYPVLMESIIFSRPRPRHVAWVEMERALGVQLSKALRGEIPPEEALSTAQSELETIIEGGGS